MTESSRREKDLPMTEEFEYVRGIDPNGRSVNVPKSLFGGNLDVASEEVLGGVKASPKSETDTNEVKIDPETGKLYCPPSEVSMATAEQIGGIVADVKTSEETEEVKIDPNTGKLYVPKGEGTPPDEEDITLASLGDSSVLQFKNRGKDKGMGYVILRTGKNLMSQISEPNTIYEVRYDFDLNGGTFEIPADCVLDFKGGSFNNGTLVGNNTSINAGVCKIFDTDIVIDGTWNVTEAYAEWFGAVGDGTTDDRPAIQKICDYFNVVTLSNKTYILDSCDENGDCINLRQFTTFRGCKIGQNGDNPYYNLKVGKSIRNSYRSVLRVNTECDIHNLYIYGGLSPMDFSSNTQCTGVTGASDNGPVNKIIIENVHVTGCWYGINIATWQTVFTKCLMRWCKYGYVIHGWEGHAIANPYNESTYIYEITSITMQSCYANHCFYGGYYFSLITYSTFISLAADGCGLVQKVWENPPYTTFTDDVVKPAYNIYRCKGASFLNCGAEGCIKTWRTEDTKNVRIEGGAIYPLNQSDMDLMKVIHSVADYGCKVSSINIMKDALTNNTSKFIYVEGHSSGYPSDVMFDDINFRITGKGDAVRLTPEYITTINQTYNLCQIRNSQDLLPIVEDVYSPVAHMNSWAIYQHFPVDRTYQTYNQTYGINIYLAAQTNGYGGCLTFNGNGTTASKNNLHLTAASGPSFRNFRTMIFQNLKILSHSSNANSVENFFKFQDCGTVIFRNCQFEEPANKADNYQAIIATGTNIILENTIVPERLVPTQYLDYNEIEKFAYKATNISEADGYRYYYGNDNYVGQNYSAAYVGKGAKLTALIPVSKEWNKVSLTLFKTTSGYGCLWLDKNFNIVKGFANSTIENGGLTEAEIPVGAKYLLYSVSPTLYDGFLESIVIRFRYG